MTGALTLDTLRELRVVPTKCSAELEALYAGAAERGNLEIVDYLTLRDLLELSGCGDEPVHALLLALFAAVRDGNLSVALTEEALARRLESFLDAAPAAAWAHRVAALKDDFCPRLMASVEHGQPKAGLPVAHAAMPLVCVTRGGARRVYFQKFFRHEESLRAQLAARLDPAGHGQPGTRQRGCARLPVAQLRRSIDDVLTKNPLMADGQPVVLDDWQKAALALGVLNKVCVISGGPGTGKTFLIFTLLRLLVRQGVAPDRIFLAAPTGRAAQRVTDFIREGLQRLRTPPGETGPDAALNSLAGSTVHRLLKYNPARGRFTHDAANPLPADVVIVDEVSMLDVVLMSRLLEALPPAASVILLGDKDQLPSVEAGAVLAGLMPPENAVAFSAATLDLLRQLFGKIELTHGQPSAGLPVAHDAVVILPHNYRSQRDLVAVAQRVNRGDASVVDELPRLTLESQASSPSSGCWLLETGADLAPWRRVLDAWAHAHYLSAADGAESYAALVARCARLDLARIEAEQAPLLPQLFARLESARVLTLVREGWRGAAGVNAYLAQRLGPHLDPHGSATVFAGAPLLIVRNDNVTRLYNGDVGVVLATRGTYRAIFQTSTGSPQQGCPWHTGGYVSFALDALPPHELAFALTVHKSQGSAYGEVLLALPSAEARRMLSREIIYTAITRARARAVICGQPAVLKQAICRALEREPLSGLWAE
jgi:exodeoxyribonuclease V alpha subunit